MPKIIPDGCCLICEEFMEVIVSNVSPWIDGKDYAHMCFTCYSLHKTGDVIWDEKNGYGWKEFDDDSIHLRSVEEMLDDGWEDKKRVQESIRSVKAALRKVKKRVARNTPLPKLPPEDKPLDEKKSPSSKKKKPRKK